MREEQMSTQTLTTGRAGHARRFRCDGCGKDEVVLDVVTGRAMVCAEQHARNEPCKTVPCSECIVKGAADRRERIDLSESLR